MAKADKLTEPEYIKVVHRASLLMSNRHEELLENETKVGLTCGKKGSLVSTFKKTAEGTEEAWNKNERGGG